MARGRDGESQSPERRSARIAERQGATNRAQNNQAGSPSKAILEGKIEDLQKKIATLEEECSESRRFAGQLASLNVLLAKMQDNLQRLSAKVYQDTPPAADLPTEDLDALEDMIALWETEELAGGWEMYNGPGMIDSEETTKQADLALEPAGGKSQEDNEGTAGLIRTLSDDLSNTFLKDNELLEIDWFPQAYVPQASKKVLPEPQEAVPQEQDVEAHPQHEHSEASADHAHTSGSPQKRRPRPRSAEDADKPPAKSSKA